MHKIYRLMTVIIFVMIILIVCLDYFGFHGSIILNNIGNGYITKGFDATGNLLQGPGSTANILYLTILFVGFAVGLIAIFYKFVKG
jgi:hypothetical protein